MIGSLEGLPRSLWVHVAWHTYIAADEETPGTGEVAHWSRALIPLTEDPEV